MSAQLPPYDFQGVDDYHFTPVPDVVFDELMPRLTEAEFKVLCYILRRTRGFKKDADAISRRQLVSGITRRDGTALDHGTGMSDPSVGRGIKGLLEKGIILTERRSSATAGDEATVYRVRVKPALQNVGRGEINLTPARPTPDAPQETVPTHRENGSSNNVLVENELRRLCRAHGWPAPTPGAYAIVRGCDVPTLQQAAIGARDLVDVLMRLQEGAGIGAK